MLTVREDAVLLPDGKTARREWIQHPGAVVMIPMLDERTVLLERQYRYPLQRHFYELPPARSSRARNRWQPRSASWSRSAATPRRAGSI